MWNDGVTSRSIPSETMACTWCVCVKPVKDGLGMGLESIRWLWLECIFSTDEPENESRARVGSSSLGLAKNLGALWARPSAGMSNRGPKAMDATDRELGTEKGNRRLRLRTNLG